MHFENVVLHILSFLLHCSYYPVSAMIRLRRVYRQQLSVFDGADGGERLLEERS